MGFIKGCPGPVITLVSINIDDSTFLLSDGQVVKATSLNPEHPLLNALETHEVWQITLLYAANL